MRVIFIVRNEIRSICMANVKHFADVQNDFCMKCKIANNECNNEGPTKQFIVCCLSALNIDLLVNVLYDFIIVSLTVRDFEDI